MLLGMVVAVGLATWVPQWGRTGGIMHLERYVDAGIFVLFFLHGVNMSTHSLKLGARAWQLHLLVQCSTFCIFPLWWWVLHALLGRWVGAELSLGFFYLAVLPSTVATAVATTTLARGNVVAAILSAALSSLLGVVLTPLWVNWMIRGSGQALALGPTLLNISLLLLLPMALGQLLRPWVGAGWARLKPYITVIDRLIIVMLVWSSFSDSVSHGLWSQQAWSLLLMTFIGAGLFLFPMLAFTRGMARALGFRVEEEITAVMCGSKKSLASGIPMAALLFGPHAALGFIVLPLMFYHQLQLFVCTLMARQYAQRKP